MTREEAIWWVNHLFEIRKEEYFKTSGYVFDDDFVESEVEEWNEKKQLICSDGLKEKPTETMTLKQSTWQ